MTILEHILSLLLNIFNNLLRVIQIFGFRRDSNNNFLLKKYMQICIVNCFKASLTLWEYILDIRLTSKTMINC